MRHVPTAFLVVLIAFTNFYSQPVGTPGTGPIQSQVSAKVGDGMSEESASQMTASTCDSNLRDVFEDPHGPIDKKHQPSQRAKDHEVRFIIATVPDPVHTHLALEFDRLVEGIQQAAAESGYTFESLSRPPPWPVPKEDNSSSELEISEVKTANPEKYDLQINKGKDSSGCPGQLIFRKHSVGNSELEESYLVVLLVGEEPTAGVNTKQFLSAFKTIRAKDPGSGVIGILGPSFSGSYSSLSHLLTAAGVAQCSPTRVTATMEPFFVIRSSSTMSNAEINWFRERNYCRASLISFFDTVEDQQEIVMKFLSKEGVLPDRIAVLSEDETAFGDLTRRPMLPTVAGDSPGLKVYFPRGIAALRTAYQEEASLVTNPENNRAPRTTLKPDFGTSGEEDDDTVPTYDPKRIPLSQEGVLQEIVRTLRQHRVNFVIIRATDEMDTLFLAGQLRKSYPEGRLITLGADLLARRDTDDNTLRGVLSVSNYPPFQGWVDEDPADDTHRIFADSTQEGQFNATLDLIQEIENPCTVARQQSGPLLLPRAHYAGFMGPKLDRISQVKDEKFRPRLWLSTVGRDGYWPLTVLMTDNLRADLQEPNNTAAQDRCQVRIGGVQEPVACGPRPAEGPDGGKRTKPIFRGMSVEYSSINLVNFKHFVLPLAIPKSMFLDRSYFLNGLVIFVVAAISVAFIYAIWFGKIANIGSVVGQALGPLRDPRRARLMTMGTAVLMVAWFLLIMNRLVLIPWFVLSAAVLCNVWILRKGSIRETALWLAGPTAATVGLYFLVLVRPTDAVTRFIYLYRADHFSSGVSPNLPLLFICCGALWWIWYQLKARSSFDIRRPLLPRGDGITIPSHDRFGNVGSARSLLFSRGFAILAIGSFVPLCFQRLRLHSLEGLKLDYIYNLALCLGLLLLLNSLYAAWVYWQRCRDLLSALNRTPLRYSFTEISGFEWQRVWGLAGADAAFAYWPMVRAWGALERLNGSLDSLQKNYLAKTNELLQNTAGQLIQQLEPLRSVVSEIGRPQVAGNPLRRLPALFRELKYRALQQLDFNQLFCRRMELLQSTMSGLATMVYHSVLKNYWQQDQRWVTRSPKKKDKQLEERGAKEAKGADAVCPVPPAVQWAEEFVALVYISFIIRVLVRIRWLGMTAIGIYVFLLLAATVYPFEPKGTIHAFFVFVFLAMLGTIGLIYAQMHRNDTLSHLTDTQPGELGADYWWRMISFAGIPLFTLITTQVPQLSRTFFFWVKPLLDGIGKG